MRYNHIFHFELRENSDTKSEEVLKSLVNHNISLVSYVPVQCTVFLSYSSNHIQ